MFFIARPVSSVNRQGRGEWGRDTMWTKRTGRRQVTSRPPSHGQRE